MFQCRARLCPHIYPTQAIFLFSALALAEKSGKHKHPGPRHQHVSSKSKSSHVHSDSSTTASDSNTDGHDHKDPTSGSVSDLKPHGFHRPHRHLLQQGSSSADPEFDDWYLSQDYLDFLQDDESESGPGDESDSWYADDYWEDYYLDDWSDQVATASEAGEIVVVEYESGDRSVTIEGDIGHVSRMIGELESAPSKVLEISQQTQLIYMQQQQIAALTSTTENAVRSLRELARYQALVWISVGALLVLGGLGLFLVHHNHNHCHASSAALDDEPMDDLEAQKNANEAPLPRLDENHENPRRPSSASWGWHLFGFGRLWGGAARMSRKTLLEPLLDEEIKAPEPAARICLLPAAVKTEIGCQTAAA